MNTGLRTVVMAAVVAGFGAALLACSGNKSTSSEVDVGRATLSLARVPDDAFCLEIVVSGSRTTTRRFDLVPGESAEQTLQGLPLGEVSFSALTYALACALVSQGPEPTWMSDAVIATLAAGQTAQVELTLRRPGRARVEIEFEEDPPVVVPDGGADASPPACALGPYGDGDVWDRTYDFQNPFFVPVAVGPNGRLHLGVYRGYAFSDDDGKTWTFKDLSAQISPRQTWPQPAVSADGQSVWLSVRGQGTLLSLDGGGSFAWVPALSVLSPFERGWVTISPYHDQHVLAFASSEDAFGSLAGTLYRSMDSGATWVNLDGAIARAGGNGTHAATFDPATPDHFWIADMPEGVFETRNGGASFAQVPGSTHSFISAVARTFDGTNERLVVTGACEPAKSTVIGRNVWQSSSGDAPHCCPWPVVVSDPFDPSATVVHQCHDSDPANLRYSTNGGVALSLASWPTSLDTTTPPTPLHVHSVQVDPHHRRTFYATHQNQWTLLKSTDGGKTWTAVGWLPGRGC